jgi:hypothetical protein
MGCDREGGGGRGEVGVGWSREVGKAWGGRRRGAVITRRPNMNGPGPADSPRPADTPRWTLRQRGRGAVQLLRLRCERIRVMREREHQMSRLPGVLSGSQVSGSQAGVSRYLVPEIWYSPDIRLESTLEYSRDLSLRIRFLVCHAPHLSPARSAINTRWRFRRHGCVR